MYPSPVSSSTVGISSPNGFPTSLGSPSIVIRAEENGYSPTMATQSIYRATTSASRRARATGQYHSAPTPPPALLLHLPGQKPDGAGPLGPFGSQPSVGEVDDASGSKPREGAGGSG